MSSTSFREEVSIIHRYQSSHLNSCRRHYHIAVHLLEALFPEKIRPSSHHIEEGSYLRSLTPFFLSVFLTCFVRSAISLSETQHTSTALFQQIQQIRRQLFRYQKILNILSLLVELSTLLFSCPLL